MTAATRAPPPVPAWDQAAADAVLAEVRAEVERISADFGDRPPPALAALLADAVRVGERFVRCHETETGRGWNPVDLLRDLLAVVWECASNFRTMERKGDKPAPPRRRDRGGTSLFQERAGARR